MVRARRKRQPAERPAAAPEDTAEWLGELKQPDGGPKPAPPGGGSALTASFDGPLASEAVGALLRLPDIVARMQGRDEALDGNLADLGRAVDRAIAWQGEHTGRLADLSQAVDRAVARQDEQASGIAGMLRAHIDECVQKGVLAELKAMRAGLEESWKSTWKTDLEDIVAKCVSEECTRLRAVMLASKPQPGPPRAASGPSAELVRTVTELAESTRFILGEMRALRAGQPRNGGAPTVATAPTAAVSVPVPGAMGVFVEPAPMWRWSCSMCGWRSEPFPGREPAESAAKRHKCRKEERR